MDEKKGIMMKKLFSIFVLLFVLVVLVSCSSVGGNGGSDPSKEADSTQQQKPEEIVAKIVTKSGDTKQMTFDEIKNLEESNSPLFSKEYFGASIEFTGKVRKIGGQFSFWGIYKADAYLEIGDSEFQVWFVEVPENEVLNYNVGDTVHVKGVLSSANGGAGFTTLYIFEEGGVRPIVTII